MLAHTCNPEGGQGVGKVLKKRLEDCLEIKGSLLHIYTTTYHNPFSDK